jgi:hypothetical protein
MNLYENIYLCAKMGESTVIKEAKHKFLRGAARETTIFF